MKTYLPALLPILLLGCYSHTPQVRTPGTAGKPESELVRLYIPAHYGNLKHELYGPLHLTSVTVDRLTFPLRGDDLSLLVTPGTHEVRVEVDWCDHWGSGFDPAMQVFKPVLDKQRQEPLDPQAGETWTLRCHVNWNSGPWLILRFDRIE